MKHDLSTIFLIEPQMNYISFKLKSIVPYNYEYLHRVLIDLQDEIRSDASFGHMVSFIVDAAFAFDENDDPTFNEDSFIGIRTIVVKFMDEHDMIIFKMKYL